MWGVHKRGRWAFLTSQTTTQILTLTPCHTGLWCGQLFQPPKARRNGWIWPLRKRWWWQVPLVMHRHCWAARGGGAISQRRGGAEEGRETVQWRSSPWAWEDCSTEHNLVMCESTMHMAWINIEWAGINNVVAWRRSTNTHTQLYKRDCSQFFSLSFKSHLLDSNGVWYSRLCPEGSINAQNSTFLGFHFVPRDLDSRRHKGPRLAAQGTSTRNLWTIPLRGFSKGGRWVFFGQVERSWSYKLTGIGSGDALRICLKRNENGETHPNVQSLIILIALWVKPLRNW